jgi:hypothetical protein
MHRAPIIKNHASCANYPGGQTNYPTLQKNVLTVVTAVQLLTCVADSSMCIEHIINPV